MDFGEAIRALKEGKRVARKGWNGKGMWLVLVSPDDDRNPPKGPRFIVENLANDYEEAYSMPCLPTIAMKTAPGDVVLGWLASQTDMLAEDWVLAD